MKYIKFIHSTQISRIESNLFLIRFIFFLNMNPSNQDDVVES